MLLNRFRGFPSPLLFIAALFLFLPLCHAQTKTVLDNDLLIPKTVGKIELIGQELRQKTGINTYVVAKSDLEGSDYAAFRASLEKSIEDSHVVVVFILAQKKIDLFSSADLETSFEKNTVFWDYMMDIMPKKEKDLTPQRISAVVLSGYDAMTTQLAQSRGVSLASSLPKDDAGTHTMVRMAMIAMLVILIGVLFYSWRRRK